MRRDDLRRSFLSPDGVRDLLPVSDGEALDAIGRKAALKHWLTDLCAGCNKGWIESAEGAGMLCPACDGRGWTPKEGGYFRLDPTLDERSLTPVVVVPLSMLEGDDQ